MQPYCLHIEQLTKQYTKGSYSLNIDLLDIQQGEIYGIIGPNGAGKTTLISILCGILQPSSGTFQYQIKDQLHTSKSIKKYLGYVPQEYAFYEELTPTQNLSFFGAMYNMNKEEIFLSTNKMLSMLGLDNTGNKKVKQFSGGMKRRVNLAIGLLHQPKILFLDEPTVGVDVQSKRAILSYLKEENSRGTTIIYTSHNMADAEDLCTSFALLDFGKILASGPLDEVLKTENATSLEEFFIKKTGESFRDY